MLQVEHTGNTFILSFYNTNKINVLVTKDLEKRAVEFLNQPYSTLIFNLSGIDFIDSAGFQSILSIYRQARLNNSSVKLINVSEETMEIIKLVEFDKILEIEGISVL